MKPRVGSSFPSASSCTDLEKKELGLEMLQHCKGVPLAIIVLAKVLQKKDRVEEWIQLRNDISSQIRRGRAPGLYKEVYDVLQVSYDELPYHLKNCFLHLVNFPEDYEIPTEKLYQLWVAEGIVSKEDTVHELEEEGIAERYLKELVSRSMVQPARWIKGTQRIRTCRLHDLMRDICIDISKREGFIEIVNCNGPMLLINNSNAAHPLIALPEIDKWLRRVAVYVSDEEPRSSYQLPTSRSAKVSRAPNLRSLLLFIAKEQRAGNEKQCTKFVETISKDFPLLRVLDCENVGIRGTLSKKVKKLIHLRYLGLAKTCVDALPSSIEKLQWLQTLDLRVGDDVVLITIPNILWKMKQLRHIYLLVYGDLNQKGYKGALPKYKIKRDEKLQLDGLLNLQTLVHIDLDRLEINDGLKLERLKMLSAACQTTKEPLDHFIKHASYMESLTLTLRLHASILNEDPEILSRAKGLRCLDIHGDGEAKKVSPSQQLSWGLVFPSSLVDVGIWYIRFHADPLPALGSCLALFVWVCGCVVAGMKVE